MNIIKSFKNLSKGELILWLSSLFFVILLFVFQPNGDFLNLITTLIGVTALIFIAKGDPLGQLLTVIFSCFYAIVSFKFRYYGEMITYIGMTAPTAFASMIIWIKNPYKEQEVKVGSIKKSGRALVFSITTVVTILFYFILKALGTSNLLFSTISIATSFSASSLMMLRSPYYAIAYALNDIVLIILWIMATISSVSYLPMVLCFVIFFINDMYGFYSWQKMKKRQKNGL